MRILLQIARRALMGCATLALIVTSRLADGVVDFQQHRHRDVGLAASHRVNQRRVCARRVAELRGLCNDSCTVSGGGGNVLEGDDVNTRIRMGEPEGAQAFLTLCVVAGNEEDSGGNRLEHLCRSLTRFHVRVS